MEEKKRIVDGYEFDSIADFDAAREDAEKIKYIRASYDLKDDEALKKIYAEYTESKAFTTPVGLGFLREIQKRLARDAEYRKQMRPIPVTATKRQPAESKSENVVRSVGKKKINTEALTKYYRDAVRIRNIVIVFLVIAIAGLFAFEIYSRNSFDEEAEREAILNEYAGWAEELSHKEAELKALENSLKSAE